MTVRNIDFAPPRRGPAPANPQTEQAARYQRILAKIADRRRQGVQMVTVRISDLEALIAIAATTDAALKVA